MRKKIKEFKKFEDDECKVFDKILFKYRDDSDEKDRSFYTSLREYVKAFPENELPEDARNLETITGDILDGKPYLSIWMDAEDPEAETLLKLYKKVDGKKGYYVTEITNGLKGRRNISVAGVNFLFSFDEDECRKSGMVGARDYKGRYLCHDGSFYAPTMNFLPSEKKE